MSRFYNPKTRKVALTPEQRAQFSAGVAELELPNERHAVSADPSWKACYGLAICAIIAALLSGYLYRASIYRLSLPEANVKTPLMSFCQPHSCHEGPPVALDSSNRELERRVRWYFSSNSDSYAPLLAASIRSAAAHSDVEPHLVLPWGVLNTSKMAALASKYPSIVTCHTFSAATALAAFEPNARRLSVALGAFMRFDVPLLHAASVLCETFDWVRTHTAEAAARMALQHPLDNVVLYTDSDCLFVGPVTKDISDGSLRIPELFAVNAESDRSDIDIFNSGVMLINTSAWLTHFPRIIRMLDDTRWACMAGAFDQPCLQEYAKSIKLLESPTSRLPDRYNWKPYYTMGPHDAPPRILHFHGPKPPHIKLIADARQKNLPVPDSMPSVYALLFDKNPQGEKDALAMFLIHEDPQFRV
jgi:hypothetical protein